MFFQKLFSLPPFFAKSDRFIPPFFAILLLYLSLNINIMYLKRTIDKYLNEWKVDKYRKPLLIRGARQTGKSTSVRELAKNFKYFIEINFEQNLTVHRFFEGNLFPKEICKNLSLYYDTPIEPGETLIFFDEIQSCPRALESMRYFYEQMPSLHLISAGSLLEFALSEIISYGVGRISNMFIYPFSFDEFLLALSEKGLLEAKRLASPETPLNAAFHETLLQKFKWFLITGGMPEAVSSFVDENNFDFGNKILNNLLISFQTDFAKYKRSVPSLRINDVFNAVSHQIGEKFMYSKTDIQANGKQVKEALELLIKAGLVIPVTHSSGNGIPLGAEKNERKRKMLILDTGIYFRMIGLNLKDLVESETAQLINKGKVAELFAGLEIIKAFSPNISPELFYWVREKAGSSAELDYLLQLKGKIIPVEIKSSIHGKMKSMHIFLNEKKLKSGVRFSLENYSKYDDIISYPIYAVSDFIKNFQ